MSPAAALKLHVYPACSTKICSKKAAKQTIVSTESVEAQYIPEASLLLRSPFPNLIISSTSRNCMHRRLTGEGVAKKAKSSTQPMNNFGD